VAAGETDIYLFHGMNERELFHLPIIPFAIVTILFFMTQTCLARSLSHTHTTLPLSLSLSLSHTHTHCSVWRVLLTSHPDLDRAGDAMVGELRVVNMEKQELERQLTEEQEQKDGLMITVREGS